MKKLLLVFLFCFCAQALHAQQGDWDTLNHRATTYLRDLIRINTALPDPQELKAARYIYKQFNRYHLDWDIFIPVKGRANLMARLKGTDPHQKPLLLISHLDTVPAAEGWTVPPFEATVKDGRI